MADHLHPSTFILREATATEKRSCWLANSISWAEKLTPEKHVAREAVCGSQDLTRDGQMRFWVFTAPGQNSSEADMIYAAAETLKKPVVVRTGNGEVLEEYSYGIASVFTPPRFRGRRVAAWMMTRLAEWLDSEEAGCRFSVLYSDIGEYYSPFGWLPFPSLETSLPPAQLTSSTNTAPITSSTLPTLCNLDVSTLVSDIGTSPLARGVHTRIAFLPTYAQAAWHFANEEFAASKLFTSPPRTPSVKGAINSSGTTWGYWAHDYNEEKLIFLRIVCLQPSSTPGDEDKATGEIADVLRAAQAEVASWGLKEVVLWNPEPLTLAACQLVLGREAVVKKRTDGSIPCLRWKGVNGKGDVERCVEWAALEKYSWC